MHHFKAAITDELVGLIFSCIVLLSYINHWQGIGELFSILLIVFFLFRLTWGKEHIHHKKRK